MIVKQLRLSNQERDRLIRVKAKTGLKNWNVICRWALCISLADDSVPFGPDIPSDSGIEMSWGTFGGDCAEIYDALFRERCRRDGIADDAETVAKYFRLHLNRGINALAAKQGPRNCAELLGLIGGED